jgi:hypothetical protein
MKTDKACLHDIVEAMRSAVSFVISIGTCSTNPLVRASVNCEAASCLLRDSSEPMGSDYVAKRLSVSSSGRRFARGSYTG